MALDPDFLRILLCPRTRRPLRSAEAAELAQINERIGRGGVRNRGGDPVAETLEAGLIPGRDSDDQDPDAAVIYPVRDDIPVLLIDSAIPLSEPAPQP